MSRFRIAITDDLGPGLPAASKVAVADENRVVKEVAVVELTDKGEPYIEVDCAIQAGDFLVPESAWQSERDGA